MSSFSARQSAILADMVSSADELRAEEISNCAGHSTSDASRAGACSSTTWALVPPIPKELTLARRTPSGFHAVHLSLTKKGLLAKSICRFGQRKFTDAGMRRCSSARMVLISPAATPAAVSRWPMFPFTDPMAQNPFRPVYARKALCSAAISMGSPTESPFHVLRYS